MKTEDVKQITMPVLERRGLFLVELKISKDNVIEILIDAMEGVNIQTCIDVSREIEAAMNRDEEDFELTVASAGIGYPFRVEEQYRKNIGNTVEVQLTDNRKLTGTLTAFDAAEVHISYEEKKQVEGCKKKQIVTTEAAIPRTNIRVIKDVVKF